MVGVLVIGMGRMLVLHTMNPGKRPKDWMKQAQDLLYPPIGKKENYQKALTILVRVAAQQEDQLSAADAKLELAWMYQDGLGVVKDEGRARNYFNEALRAYEQMAQNAEINPKVAAFANYHLGHIYEVEDYVDQGVYDDWITPNEEQSNAYFNRARELLEQVVDQYADLESVAEANLKLAHLYEAGHLGYPNNQKASNYLNRVSYNTQIPIDLRLEGLLYLVDMYKDKDQVRAISYYKEVIALAEQANKADAAHEARISLGDLYSQGDNPDFAKAIEQYEKVGEGVLGLKMRLGRLYYYGQDNVLPIDQAKAFSYFKQELEDKNVLNVDKAEAQAYLGKMYYDGQVVAKNYRQAIMFLQNALVNESISPSARCMANYTLGMMFYYGHGVPVDLGVARDYFASVGQFNENQAEWQAAQQIIQQIDTQNAGPALAQEAPSLTIH